MVVHCLMLTVIALLLSVFFAWLLHDVTAPDPTLPADLTILDAGVTEQAEWAIRGTKGDYYGGIIGAGVGLASTFAFLAALFIQARQVGLQRKDLEATLKELKQSKNAAQAQAEALQEQLQVQQRAAFETRFFLVLDKREQLRERLNELQNNAGIQGHTALYRNAVNGATGLLDIMVGQQEMLENEKDVYRSMFSEI